MAPSFCSSIKSAVVAAWTANTSVKTRGLTCVLTLPIQTLDGRFVEVFVEQKFGDSLLVHDAGKTVGELHVQGMHWTDSRRAILKGIAERFRVQLDERGVFQTLCKKNAVQQAVLAISQCASVGMFEAAQHQPVIDR